MSRWLVANFDAELSFARQRTPGPHKQLPKSLRQQLQKLAETLRVLAEPIGPTRLLGVHDLESLDAKSLGRNECTGLLAWAQSPELASLYPLRAKAHRGGRWQDALWNLQGAPGAASACSDRRLLLVLATPGDDDYPYEELRAVDSIEEVETYLQEMPLGPDEGWVLKAPFSASGRERVRRHGRNLKGDERVRAQRLLARYGQMLVEPWMPRTADYGVCGLVYDDNVQVFPAHELVCDSTGVVREIRISDNEIKRELGDQRSAMLRERARSVGDALFERGYRGPFGIDAFLYSDHKGRPATRSLCEINPRMTMGLLARAWAERTGADDYRFHW